MRGEGLARPMAETKLFPGAVIQMIRVGENTGTLERAARRSAPTSTDRSSSTRSQRLTALFEPAVIVFMGVAVGFVAIALVSAMYGIYQQVQF